MTCSQAAGRTEWAAGGQQGHRSDVWRTGSIKVASFGQ